MCVKGRGNARSSARSCSLMHVPHACPCDRPNQTTYNKRVSYWSAASASRLVKTEALASNSATSAVHNFVCAQVNGDEPATNGGETSRSNLSELWIACICSVGHKKGGSPLIAAHRIRILPVKFIRYDRFYLLDKR